MPRYRTKQVLVDAYQVADPTPYPQPQWLFERLALEPDAAGSIVCTRGGSARYFVRTSNGLIPAAVGDWIVRGHEGDLAVVHPHLFALGYEPMVTEPSPDRRCGGCAHWFKDNVPDLGVCKLYPPLPSNCSSATSSQAVPWMADRDWCGQFEPRQPAGRRSDAVNRWCEAVDLLARSDDV